MIGTEKQQTAQKHVYVDTIEYNIHMLTQSYSHTYIRTSLQVYVQIYINIYVHMYIYIYVLYYMPIHMVENYMCMTVPIGEVSVAQCHRISLVGGCC